MKTMRATQGNDASRSRHETHLIVACFAVYNEARTLGMAVNSVLGIVDKVVLVDGIWGTDESAPSDDGTLKIIEDLRHAYPDTIRLIGAKSWRNEAEKREEYIEEIIGPDAEASGLSIEDLIGDPLYDNFILFFILDGDEALFCGAEWLRLVQDSYPEERAFNIIIWNKGGPNTLHPRVYRPFSYRNLPQARVTLPIVIEHLEYLRPAKRDLWRRAQYDKS